MIRRSLVVAATIALAAPAVAVAQSAEEVTYWFHCGGPGKVQNVASLSGGATWDRTAPTGSFRPPDAAGCGFVDPPGTRTETQNVYDAVFSGVHAGPIGAVVLELHSLVTSRARPGETVALNVRLIEAADGTLLLDRDVTVEPEPSSTGASEKMVIELVGLAIPAGAADRMLTIAVDTKVPHPPQAWVFDATEVPANVTFTEAPLTLTLGTPRGVEEASICADGSALVGMNVGVDPWDGYISNVAAICRDAAGAETTAARIGAHYGSYPSGSRCADGDAADGLVGRVGDIIDAVGVGCETTDGPIWGGGGGEPRAARCAEGARLEGLKGTRDWYFGREVLTSITAVCG